MKRKILIITLTVIALTLIIISVVSLTNKEENKSSKEESKLQENAIKLADPSEIDPTNSWEAVYLTTLIDISKNVYPKDKDIPLNGRTKAFVTLKDLSENHGIDISKFQTEINCDVETTGILFYKQGSEILRIPTLTCTK